MKADIVKHDLHIMAALSPVSLYLRLQRMGAGAVAPIPRRLWRLWRFKAKLKHFLLPNS